METTVLGVILGLLLFIAPLYLFQAYALRFSGKMVKAVVTMLVKYGVLGGVLYTLFLCDSLILNVVFCIAMIATTAIVTVAKAHISLRSGLVPVLAGAAVAVVIVGSWLLFAVMQLGTEVSVAQLVPVAGLICGAILEIESKALSFYYMGLRNHNEMYSYFLANGATSHEALFYFRKRALERVATHWLSFMSASVLSSTPFILWAMLLAGASVLTAVTMQIVLVGAAFCASMCSVAVALAVASRYFMDGYGRLIQDAAAKTGISTQPDTAASPYAEQENQDAE